MIVNKTVNDYVEELSIKYPDVSKSDIQKILTFGWKQIYLFNSYGGDVVINTPTIWCYFGTLYSDSIKFFNYYIKKLSVKFRVLFKRYKEDWDGYYYFALTDSQYEKYLSQIKTKGRKRKYFTFNNIYLYKLIDECKIKNFNKKYIFRTKVPTELGFYIFKKEYTVDSPELIIVREQQKFKDILINNNDYKFV